VNFREIFPGAWNERYESLLISNGFIAPESGGRSRRSGTIRIAGARPTACSRRMGGVRNENGRSGIFPDN
jgi:hypothetical protein